MQDIAVRSQLPIAISQPNQPLQSVIESTVDEEADGAAHENLREVRLRGERCGLFLLRGHAGKPCTV